jgi:hypothetical protein
MVLRIRKGGTPEPDQKKIYEILKIPCQVMKPIKTWQEVEHSDWKKRKPSLIGHFDHQSADVGLSKDISLISHVL